MTYEFQGMTPGPLFPTCNDGNPCSKWRVDRKPAVPWGNFGEVAMFDRCADAMAFCALPDILKRLAFLEVVKDDVLFLDAENEKLIARLAALEKVREAAKLSNAIGQGTCAVTNPDCDNCPVDCHVQDLRKALDACEEVKP